MRRRDFITGIPALAGSLVLPRQAARAQQPVVIGFLDSGAEAGMTANLAEFHRGLGEMGFTEGRNITVEYRWAQANYGRLPELAADLVRRNVDAIAATRGPGPTLAAKAATKTIPIVFQTGGDPVKDGLVESLNRPGGNVTGASRLSVDLMPKRLGMLTDLKPKAATIALLVNRGGPQATGQIREIETAIRPLGLKLHVVSASTPPELDAAFADIAQSHADALIVASDPLFIGRREQIVALALRHGVPTIFGEREFGRGRRSGQLCGELHQLVSSGRRICRARAERRQAG